MFGTRLRHLPAPLIASGVVAVLGAIVGGLAGGVVSAIGAFVGVAIVAVGFTFSVVVISWADSINPKLVLPFGMGVYVLKITWLGMGLLVAASHQWSGMRALGIGIMAGVVCWVAAQIWTVVREDPRSAGSSTGTAVPSRAPQE